MSLTAQQTRHFRDSGYLRLPGVVPEPLAARLRRLVRDEVALSLPAATDARVTTDARLTTGTRVATDAPGGLPKLYRLYERDPELVGELITTPRLVGALRSLLGPNVVYVLNRHNQAAVNGPGTSEPRLHRDVLQWSRGLVTAVVYLEESTVASGCTHLVPGSHFLPFVGVPQPDGGGTWMDEHVEFADLLDQALPVPVPAGGVLLFDSLAFHTVSANTSDRGRMSLVLGFRSADELDRYPDRGRQIVVSGGHLYRGNDRAPGPPPLPRTPDRDALAPAVPREEALRRPDASGVPR